MAQSIENVAFPKEVADNIFKSVHCDSKQIMPSVTPDSLVNTGNIPVQHPMGDILKNKVTPSKSLIKMPPITSIVKSFSGYQVSYALMGGLLGSGYGYFLMKKATTRRYITQSWEEDDNMGYIFWGGLIGLCVGKFTGNLIKIM